MSFRLNELSLISEVFENIPFSEIQLIIQEFPILFLQKLLNFISNHMENSPHLEFHLIWCHYLFNYYGKYLKDYCSSSFISIFRNLQKIITKQYQDLSKM